MKYHDNTLKVTTQPSAGVASCRFIVDDFSITGGQDPDGSIQRGQEHLFYGPSGSFTFRVGRKGDSSVAKFWKSHFAASESTFNHNPDELNFAFYGPLDIQMGGQTYRIPKVGLAQGHAGASNNWWFAAQGASRGPLETTIVCTGTSQSGSTVRFTVLRGGNSGVEQMNIYV
jgi:hypothetical protein